MARPTVLLFDLDGTLLSSSGAGRVAMERGFRDVVGVEDAFAFPFDGMTDRAIVRRALATAGRTPAAADIDAVIDAYLSHLPTCIGAASDYRVFPGVLALLEAAARAADVAVGLGTGNIERGAALKLGHVGLGGYFGFGGYGSDHEPRPAIIRTGAERGAARLGVPLVRCRVVVIGDTPHDVGAAVALEAECLGVATGRFSIEVLRGAGAHHAVTDLADPAAARVLLG